MVCVASLFSPFVIFPLDYPAEEKIDCWPLEKGPRKNEQSSFAFQRALSFSATAPFPDIGQHHLCNRVQVQDLHSYSSTFGRRNTAAENITEEENKNRSFSIERYA